MDNGLFRHIAEVHMGKGHRTVDKVRRQGVFRVRGFLFLFQEGEYPFRSGSRLLEDVGDVGNLGDRLGELADILGKCLDVAHGNGAV